MRRKPIHIHIHTGDVAKWDESKHPRKDDGKFGAGSSSGGPLTPQQAEEFLDRWHGGHRDHVSEKEIDAILKAHPEWAHTGTVHRIVELPSSAHAHFADYDGANLDEVNSNKLEAYIAQHEKAGYVSGSETSKGIARFETLGSLATDENLIVELEYEVKDGLSLRKMAAFSGSDKRSVKQIADVEEVLFKPSKGKFLYIGTPD